VTKPDLIELSTDWDTALLVADRYTGTGGGPNSDAFFIEQGKRVLAAMLLIANKEGYGYGWIDEVLGERDLHRIKDEIERNRESSASYGLPVRMLSNALWSTDRERSGILSTAYLMFSKALQPRSALDPHVLLPPPAPPRETPPSSYG
jgi:hypothetical protein